MTDPAANERQDEDLRQLEAQEALSESRDVGVVFEGADDAGGINEFEDKARKHWEQGKEIIRNTGAEGLLKQSPLDFDKEPGLQIRELDELAVNLGFLIIQALKENPELDANGFRAWLQQNSPDNPALKQGAYYLVQAFQSDAELAKFIQEGFPDLFATTKEAVKILEENKGNPNFLTESLAYLEEQKNEVVNHPDGMLQGAVDKGYEAATGIWEFTKKNSKKLAATVLIVGGTFMIGKWLFGGDEKTPSTKSESAGGFWKNVLGLGGLSVLGSELITKLWGGKTATEWVMEQIGKLTENITGKVTEAVGAKIKAPLISALSVVIGEDEAKKMVDELFAQVTEDENDEATSSTETGENNQDALLGTVGGNVEWLEKTIGFTEKKGALIEQITSMGFEVPEWLQKLSPQEIIASLGIDQVKNSTVLWNTGKFGAVGFLLFKYASLRGLAINGGLYMLFIREGENSWGAELIKNSIQEMQALKENLYGMVGEQFPLLASALETLDIDFTLLTPHLDNFAEYAKSNPITTLAAANAAWLFRGFLWSAIQKAGVAFQKSLVFALQNPTATAAIAITGFAYRKEFVDFLVDKAIPFDGAEAPKSKEWFRNELYQITGEKDESATENHTQEIVQSLTHEVGTVAVDLVEIANEIRKGNIGLSLLETGETVIHYVVAGNPVTQVISLAVNDFWQLVENVTGSEESEGNMSSLWLTIEGVILSRFAYKGAVAYKSIWEASKTSASIGQNLPIRLLKSAGFPITAEGRFIVRSMLDYQAFANLRLSGHVGQVEGIVRDIDAILANQSLSQAEKIVQVEKIAGNTQKIVSAKFAERLNTLKGFGTTHQSLRLYEQLGSIQDELRDLRQEVTQAGVTEQKRMEDITNRTERIKAKITNYRSFASNLLGRWNRMTSIVTTNIADSPQLLKTRIQGMMTEVGRSATVEPTTTAARITPDTRSTSFNSSNVVRLDDHRPRPGGGSARMPVEIDPSPSTGGQRAPTIAPSESRPAATGTTGRLRTPAEIAATSAPKTSTQVGAIDGIETGPGNTVRKVNPIEVTTQQPSTKPLTAAELNKPLSPEIQAANDNIAKKLNLPPQKVQAVASGLSRVLAPTMVAIVMSDIANSKEPEKTAAEHAVFLTLILGATATLGPIGGLVMLAAVTAKGGEIADYVGWSVDQLSDFAKEKFGFDIRAFGNSDTAAVREVARYSLGYLDPINRLADPLFEKMGFEFAMGTNARDFFSETEMASVNIDDKPMIMPVHQHGETDIPKWNAYAQEQLGEVERNQRLAQSEIERLQQAIELTPDKDSPLHTFYQDRLQTFQQKKEQLQILQTHWQLQIIDNTPREVEGLENKTTWLQRETMILQERFAHLQRMRLALSLPDSAFVEVIDHTEAIVLQNRNPLTDPTIRETFDQVAESDTILQFKTKVDQATSEKDFSVADLFTSYVTELEAVRDHARALSVMGMWDKAFPEGAPLDLQKIIDAAPTKKTSQGSSS